MVLAALAFGGLAAGWVVYLRGPASPGLANSMLVLQPYRHAHTWVFDDPQLGLKQEAFVAGIPQILDRLTADIPNADQGFRLIFSAQPFPGSQIEMTWLRTETIGNWYRCEEYRMEGWLCPALNRYFSTPPKKLYARAEPLKAP